MGDFGVFYLCDRKACENCNEECHHTSDMEHAVNRYEFNGRMFQFINSGDRVGFFEIE